MRGTFGPEEEEEEARRWKTRQNEDIVTRAVHRNIVRVNK